MTALCELADSHSVWYVVRVDDAGKIAARMTPPLDFEEVGKAHLSVLRAHHNDTRFRLIREQISRFLVA